MHPSIWIYGGVHDDPGSRQKFHAELAKQETPPQFVAVEEEQSLFKRLAVWRSCIAEALKLQWNFLTPEDCSELSFARVWEGDSHAERFPNIDVMGPPGAICALRWSVRFNSHGESWKQRES
jgi:hypothetical protein